MLRVPLGIGGGGNPGMAPVLLGLSEMSGCLQMCLGWLLSNAALIYYNLHN
jgi:hypothetical protein